MSRSKSRGWRFAGVILVLAVGGALSWWAGRTPSRPARRPNVLLITIDTLRADALGAYGRAGSPTPRLDLIAAAGVRFANAYAHNVVTLPSHANILSGRLPPEHGIRDNAGFRFPEDVETLATYLQRQGYRTGAFVSAFPLDSRFGLARGFDVYDDRSTGGSRPAFLIQERSADRTIAHAKAWIDVAADAPWFAWVHLYEPHYPYTPPAALASRWPGNPYLAEVAAADAALGPLLDPVLAARGEGHTLVVVTSDHGEALGEHGESSHGIFAYESVLRVPLVIHAPHAFKPAVVDVPAGHVDLLPTVLDALGLPIPSGLDGRSLMAVITGTGRDPRPPVYFEALSASLNRGWAPLSGIIQDRFKYIDLPLPELYDLAHDPMEQHNLATSEPGRVNALRGRLLEYRSLDRGRPQRQEPAEVRDRLRSLGYVTGGRPELPAAYTENDDPKRLIALDGVLQEILDRYLTGDLAGALARSRQLVLRRPSMAVSWMQLAQLERESGNARAAVDAMQRAVMLSAGDTEPLTQLAVYLTEAGRAREAIDLLDAPAREPHADPDLLSTRALALARLGQFEEAVAALDRARERDPSNAMPLVHLGTVRLTQGQRDAAREAFTEAIHLDPGLARAHSSLGVLAAEDGRRDLATEHWRAATSLDAREHGNILSLGIAFARAGRMVEARTCFEFFAAHAPSVHYAAELERVRAWLKGAR